MMSEIFPPENEPMSREELLDLVSAIIAERDRLHAEVERLTKERDVAIEQRFQAFRALKGVNLEMGSEIDNLKAEVERLTKERDQARESSDHWLQAANTIRMDCQRAEARLAAARAEVERLRAANTGEQDWQDKAKKDYEAWIRANTYGRK